MKTVQLARLALIGALLTGVIACTASKRTEIDTYSTEASANFSSLKTYRWDFSALGKTQPDGAHTAEFDRVLCEHVDKHMAELGYKRIDKGTSDFALDYRVVVTQQEAAVNGNANAENEQKSSGYGWRWVFGGGEKPTYQGLQAPKDETEFYRTGTLHLGAVDTQGNVIWHSSATRIIGERVNEAERRAALRIAVNKLMDTFPKP